MKEIFKYLELNNIDGRYFFDTEGNRIFEFNSHGCDIRIEYKENMTVQDFKEEMNAQYMQHLKNKEDFFKKWTDNENK